MRRIFSVAAVMAVIALALSSRALVPPAGAQAIPKSLQDAGPESNIKVRKNSWTVGVVGGLLSGTYMTLRRRTGQGAR